jgi:hypothetical protein
MTTAFLEIAYGDFAAAETANRASVPAYFGFLSNAAAAFVFLRRFL